MNKFLMQYLFLAVALSGCGGAEKLDKMPVAAPLEAIAPVATSEFLSLARGASCANLRNRMFVVDEKHVFWDKAGSCADASYEMVLYGKTSKNVLCSIGDTIAGPKTTCNDEQFRSMLLTMSKNLDKADLGLGSTHQVQQLAVAPGANWPMSFLPIYAPLHYGNATANIVIKDISAWDIFLADAQFKPVFAPLTQTDFNSKMVLGVSFKMPNNCSMIKIVKVSSNGQKMTVEYTDEERISVRSCDPNTNLASTPINLVMVDKLDLPVEFVNINAVQVAFSYLDVTFKPQGFSPVFQGAIKDVGSWNEYVANNLAGPAPTIDFTKNMVLAVSLSLGGCKSFDGVTLWRSGGKLNVAIRINDNANPQIACTLDFIERTQLIELPRMDEAIEFFTVRGATVFDAG